LQLEKQLKIEADGQESTGANISYPQARQQWFPVGIFPLKLFFGLTGNRPQSAPACSFLR
jgi:hypothetical protein